MRLWHGSWLRWPVGAPRAERQLQIVLAGTSLPNERCLTTGSIDLAAGEKVGTYNRLLEWYLSARANPGP